MKNFLTHLFLAVLLISACTKTDDINSPDTTITDPPEEDQYKMDSDDFAEAGDTIYLATDYSPSNDSLGQEGENQNWNFLDLEPDDEQLIYFVEPSTHPNGSEFPTANLAYEQEGDITVFLNKSSERLEVVGLYGDLTGEGIIVGVNYNPTQLFYNFPFTYQDSYENTSGFEEKMATVDVPDLVDLAFIADSFKIKQQNVLSTKVDAKGSITTPLGTFECIREYREETIVDSVFARFTAGGWDIVPLIPGYFEYPNPTVTTIKKYVWYAKDLGYPVAEAILDSMGTLSQINYLSEK